MSWSASAVRVLTSDLKQDASWSASEYPIAIVTNAAHPTLARAFVDFVMSADGQRALSSAGFLAPGTGAAP